jgi:hypothetical protein
MVLASRPITFFGYAQFLFGPLQMTPDLGWLSSDAN